MSCPIKAAVPTAARRSVLGATCALALISSTSAPKFCLALDLSLTGDASTAQEYDTNLFRTLAPHKAAWGQGVDGRIDFSLAEDHWDSRLNARFANRWYVTDNNLDYFNQLFNWQTKYRGEYSLWKLDSQYNRDTTLTSETDITADVGYVFRRIPRTTRVLSPSWSYSLRNDTLLNVSYEYRDITYDTNPNEATRVVDSSAHTGGLSLNHQWNERLALLASASYTDYTLKRAAQTVNDQPILVNIGGESFLTLGTLNIPAYNNSIRTTSLMAGFNFAASDTLMLGFSGGAQYNQTETPTFTISRLIGGTIPVPPRDVPAVSNNALTEVFTANAKKRFEYSDVGFDFSRSVSPNLNGNLIAYDRYSLTGNHKLTDRLSASLLLSYSQQSSPSNSSLTAFNRDIFTARTSFNWQWNEHWAINAGYQYSQVSYPQNAGTPDSHALFLNLRYLFDQHKL